MNSKEVDRERWAQMSIFEQLGNVGSEVGRAINAQRSGKISRRDSAIIRAIDLFDATAQAWAAKKSPRTKEILRAKEQFLDLFYGDSDSADSESLERYFTQFAVVARTRK
jgi:hypothetical protein